MNPSHSSQPAVQQAALPSSASASGFFVTHSPVYLTSVKKTESAEQGMEPDFSGCAFLGQQPNILGVQELWARGMQSTPFVTMLTNMIVDWCTRLRKQAQDYSLQTHSKPSAQRNL